MKEYISESTKDALTIGGGLVKGMMWQLKDLGSAMCAAGEIEERLGAESVASRLEEFIEELQEIAETVRVNLQEDDELMGGEQHEAV